MDLEKWLVTIEVELDSLLKDETRFTKTNFFFKKSGRRTPIYQEILTGNYWYADWYHKDNKFHFEVFDRQENHLGEADLEGNIIPDTIDSDKNGKLYL